MRNNNHEIQKELLRLKYTCSQMDDIVKTLDKAVKESNDLFERGKDKSFIIGFLQGCIKGAKSELGTVYSEVFDVKMCIDGIVDPLN